MKILIILLFATLSGFNVKAELKMSKIFSNNMVIQRDVPVPIWGWAFPGEKVTVQFKGQTKNAVADAAGKWMLKLSPMTASQVPAGMSVKTRSDKKEFNNVLVGDVWLCSGQSNMGDHFGYPINSKYPSGREIADELKKINNPLIRIIDKKGVGKIIPIPCKPSAFPYSGWEECNSKTAKYFSRVGYYFGEKLQKELNVPIGLVNVSCGCSAIEAWMPPMAFENSPHLQKQLSELKEFQKFYQNYDKYSNEEKAPVLLKHCNGIYGDFAKRCYMKGGKLPVDKYDNVLTHMLVVKPASLYNHAIRPIIPFAFKGVIWYQGETNVLGGTPNMRRSSGS